MTLMQIQHVFKVCSQLQFNDEYPTTSPTTHNEPERKENHSSTFMSDVDDKVVIVNFTANDIVDKVIKEKLHRIRGSIF